MTSPAATRPRPASGGGIRAAVTDLTPHTIRWAGFAGSVLLGLSAYLGGARSPWRPTLTPLTVVKGQNGVVLPLAWVVGMFLLVAAWWYGRHVVPSARWAYVTAALWAIPFLPFLPLGSYDAYSYACQGWQQSAGLDPYSGGVDVLGCPWRDAVAPTWLSSPAPYGPVFLLIGAAAAKVGGSLSGTLGMLRVAAVLGMVLTAVSLPVIARRAGVPPKQAIWLAVACPLVMIHLISGAHNDAVMVGLLVAGMALATRRWFWAAGLLFGLAIGIKATAVVVVPFAFLLAGPLREGAADPGAGWPREGAADPGAGSLREGAAIDRGAVRRLSWAAVQTFGGVAAALLAGSVVSGLGFGWVKGLTGSEVSVQWTSPSTAIGMTFKLLGVDAITVTRDIGIVVLAVALVAIWVRAFRLAWGSGSAGPGSGGGGTEGAGAGGGAYVSGKILRFSGFALAATVVLAPVFHPWYATWPLALLAATVRQPSRWLLGPVLVASVLCLPDGYNLALATRWFGPPIMTALIIYVVWKAIHEAKIRNGRAADPAGAVRGGGGRAGGAA